MTRNGYFEHLCNLSEAAKLLLWFGANVSLQERDYSECTALWPAGEAGQEEMVRLLLAHGADAAIADTHYHITPSQVAPQRGHMKIAGMIAHDRR